MIVTMSAQPVETITDKQENVSTVSVKVTNFISVFASQSPAVVADNGLITTENALMWTPNVTLSTLQVDRALAVSKDTTISMESAVKKVNTTLTDNALPPKPPQASVVATDAKSK